MKCIKKGAEPVFVTFDAKKFKMTSASKDQIEPYLGHSVEITGKVEGDTLSIGSIKLAALACYAGKCKHTDSCQGKCNKGACICGQ